ncbi:MAG: type II secretion system F family protein [Campylobacterota bacterium]|nr:type II secretion system F family protein [Campylobacterota bacterium]
MEISIIVLVIIIPILFVSLAYIGYMYYVESNKHGHIIQLLKDDGHKILEEKKKKQQKATDEDSWLKRHLGYAGFRQEYVEYIFMLISLGFGFLAASFINFVAGSPVIFVISFVIFSFFPLLFMKKMIDNRREEFNFGLKIMIDKIVSMMKSGVGFEQALKKSIATSKSKFTKQVFNIYVNEKDILGEDKTFDKMFTMVESKELRIFYLTVSIGRQSGGKFSNTLEKLRKTLHDQGEIKQEITSSTKEVKVGSYMIIALVIFIYEMMDSSMDGILDEHFFDSDEGKIQMFFIVVWISFGLFVNSMLAKVK